MVDESFEKWVRKYKWQKRRIAVSEFFGRLFAYWIITLIAIAVLIWVGIYVWFIAPYIRSFFFNYFGLYTFPAIFHAFPMFGIPILVGAFLKAIYTIVKNRSTIRPEYLKKND